MPSRRDASSEFEATGASEMGEYREWENCAECDDGKEENTMMCTVKNL